METPTFNPEEQYRKVAREWFRNRTLDRIQVPHDWADDLIKGAAKWVYESEIPSWLLQKIENVSKVFLQLPAPDHRWILKFRGDLWGPFDRQFSGWQDAHDLISVRTRTLIGTDLEKTGMWGEATLSGSGTVVVPIHIQRLSANESNVKTCAGLIWCHAKWVPNLEPFSANSFP